jgi:alkanesulfonate monooxygenase
MPRHEEPPQTTDRPELTFHRYLPPFVDSRYVVDSGYLTQLALTAEQNGFGSVLTPVGLSCEDPWIVATSLLGATDRLPKAERHERTREYLEAWKRLWTSGDPVTNHGGTLVSGGTEHREVKVA